MQTTRFLTPKKHEKTCKKRGKYITLHIDSPLRPAPNVAINYTITIYPVIRQKRPYAVLTITQHIERLLLRNDCVIIPDFGGFVVQECCARYVEEEGIFLPPYRGVVFNPRLTANDGLLADAVARDRAIDFHEATRAVEDETNELRATISNQGSCSIPGIGVLRAVDGGSYEFEPLPCGIATPALHGLDSYYVPLYHAKGERAQKAEETQLAGKDVVTIRLRRSHLRNIAAAAIVFICFALALTPGRISMRQNTPGEAGIMQQWWSTIIEHVRLTPQHPTLPSAQDAEAAHPKAVKHAPAPKTVHKPTTPTPEVTTDSIASIDKPEPAPQAAAPTPAETYTIVVASAIPLTNAQRMVDEWKARLLPEARTLETDRMVRVVCGTYACEEAAREALQHYRAAYGEFADAWIYNSSPRN